LETVVTAKRDKAAALKFLKRIIKKYVPAAGALPKPDISCATDSGCAPPLASSLPHAILDAKTIGSNA
jgi:hypothetical protein